MNIEKYNLKKENILHLPIKRVHFDRIKNKEKRLEFRVPSEHYMRRLFILDKDGEFLGEKPIKAISFQAGYAKNAPKMLVDLVDWFINDPYYAKENNFELDLYYQEDFEKDGLDIQKDQVLAFVLGEILEVRM